MTVEKNRTDDYHLGERSEHPFSLEVEGVDYTFGQGDSAKQVLFDNHLRVRPGEMVAITGPSGSGKTTLLTLMGTLRTIQTGSIRFHGQELRELGREQAQRIRRRIGFIFQGQHLFDSLTAHETLRLAMQLFPKRYTRKDFQHMPAEMLDRLGLGHRLHYKPKRLSGGQQQRVAIGRALINHPEMILADEPTSGLDKDSGRQVMELFRERVEQEGTTVFIVTHDSRTIDAVERIVHMVDGRIRMDKARQVFI
uniref:Putative ABC transport system ATP-binding protein n=1 Tax=Candidatus Kentrum sp. FW TaxID=2126338 RepID=A0A450S6M7_9GAMM|nr:MAG: putative ABC transport system ATP-binding protein [Candidatus Kentron sp. FW]VFJ67908.1 MAG: putative ABC transport system ATP-binding protein [Candidatus Kentron sp. FW]